MDRVSQGAQSAAGSVADVIESFKSETIAVVGGPPLLSVQECWLATCFALGAGCAAFFVPALLHLRHEHRCAVQRVWGASHSARCSCKQQAPSSHPSSAAATVFCHRLHATAASQEGRKLLEHSVVLVRCG